MIPPPPSPTLTYHTSSHLVSFPSVLHFVPVLLCRKIRAWSESGRGNTESQTALDVLPFTSRLIHLAQERYLGIGRGRRAEAWGDEKKREREVCREKGGLRRECLPPSARWITEKKGSTSNGLRRSRRRRRAEMEEMIAETLFFFFYWGDAGISLAGMEGRWERLRLSVCLPLIEVGKRASGCCSAPK